MANIKISDLISTDYNSVLSETNCRELAEYEQVNIQGGSWLGDAFRWVVNHIGGALTDGGFIISYKGTHDFPNNL